MASKTTGRQKTRPKSPGQTPNYEIVPGHLNDIEWNQIVETQEDNLFINSIVRDMLDCAEEMCYQNFIENSVIPLTVEQAKEALIHIVKWNFIFRDDGETLESAAKGLVKSEQIPLPCGRDNWAQACTTSVSIQPQKPESIPIGDSESQQEFESLGEEEVMVQEQESVSPPRNTVLDPPKKGLKVRNVKQLANICASPSKSKSLSLQTLSSQAQKEKRIQKHWPTEESPKFLSSHVFKTLPSRNLGRREVVFDEHGNIISAIKIEPRCVIDQKKLPVLNLREGKRSRQAEDGWEFGVVQSKQIKEKTKKRNSVSHQSSVKVRDEGINQLTFLDHIQPVAGTVVIEGKRSKRGPELSLSKQSDDHEGIVLRPVSIDPWKPKFNVSQITNI